MIRSFKFLVTACIFASVVVISLGATVAVIRRGVTPPPDFDPAIVAAPRPAPPASEEELRRVLTQRDVVPFPRDRQLELATRLELLVRSQRDWRSWIAELTPQEQRRAQENVEELVRVWFIDKAEQYAKTPDSRKEDYVAGLIDSVLTLATSAGSAGGPPTISLTAKSDDRGKSRTDPQQAMAELLGKWVARTTLDETLKATALLTAIQRQAKSRFRGKAP